MRARHGSAVRTTDRDTRPADRVAAGRSDWRTTRPIGSARRARAGRRASATWCATASAGSRGTRTGVSSRVSPSPKAARLRRRSGSCSTRSSSSRLSVSSRTERARSRAAPRRRASDGETRRPRLGNVPGRPRCRCRRPRVRRGDRSAPPLRGVARRRALPSPRGDRDRLRADFAGDVRGRATPGTGGLGRRWARPVPLALHELAAAAPFTVLVPRAHPGRVAPRGDTVPRRGAHPRLETTAFLDYMSREGAYTVASASGRARRKTKGLTSSTTARPSRPRFIVSLVRAGTWVELSGAERELLLGLAEELVPAPTQPPELER